MKKLAAALALVMMGGLPALAATPKKKKPATTEATPTEATPKKKVVVKKTNRTATTKPHVNPGDPVENAPAAKTPAAK